MKSQEFTGKTTQEAIDAGLAELGVSIADAHVDVLQEGAKGLFGLFGSKPARVRITVMEDEHEDDHGLSDLLGSFSLDSEQARRKSAKPAEKKPAEQKPVEKKPVEQKSAEKKPIEKKPVEQKNIEKKPVEQKPIEKKPAEKKAAEQKPAEKPVEKKPEAKAAPNAPAQTENAAAETNAVNEADGANEPREAAARAPRTRAPKKPRAPKREQPTQEAHDYAPMIPAEPFAPTEPPVMHDEATPAGRAQRFLLDVTERMNVKVDVYVDDSREDSLYIHMIGDTLGILIGRRGETLDALQYLTSLQVNKGREGYIRVTLDTENYRAKREDSLRRLAQRMANRAQKTGRKVVLEPMNPYERRVLHTALQNHPAVTTHSEGEEPNRRVVIMLRNQPERSTQAEKAEQGGDKPANARRRSNRRRGHRGPKPQGAPENATLSAAPQEEPILASDTSIDVLGEE